MIYAGVQELDLDVELVERHRGGDDAAFCEVYQRFGEMVYNVALRLSGHREEANDLTQEIFLRIYRHLGGFGGRSTLKTWIFRVAVNHCRDRLSRHQMATEPIDSGSHDQRSDFADPSRSPEELALAADDGRRVGDCLDRLPHCFREAVVLRDIEGLSYEEVATVLGIRVGTVRSRIARGREQLRVLLERSS